MSLARWRVWMHTARHPGNHNGPPGVSVLYEGGAETAEAVLAAVWALGHRHVRLSWQGENEWHEVDVERSGWVTGCRHKGSAGGSHE